MQNPKNLHGICLAAITSAWRIAAVAST